MSQLPMQAEPERSRSGYWRFAVWIAIGALIAAAIVCVIWVLVGPDDDIIAKAFLTILLLAGFAGVAVLDASVADRRPQWYALLSMIGWVVVLLAGAFKIWGPTSNLWWEDSFGARLFQFLVVTLVVRLAILHVWLYLRAHLRRVMPFTTVVIWVTITLVGVLAVMLILPLTFNEFRPDDFYWRVVVAIAILAAVGTAIVPLLRALNSPRPRREVSAADAGRQYGAPGAYGSYGYVAGVPQGAPVPPDYVPHAAPPVYPTQAYPTQVYPPPQPTGQSWPTYVDGFTPLPVLPDGSPDWNAYYTGCPTYPQQAPQGVHYPGTATPAAPGAATPAAAQWPAPDAGSAWPAPTAPAAPATAEPPAAQPNAPAQSAAPEHPEAPTQPSSPPPIPPVPPQP